MLRVEGLTSHYGRIQALKGVAINVEAGELVAVVGSNGAGKTTLLRTISGVQPASGGRVHFSGDDITRVAPHHRVRRGIVQVPEGRQVFGTLSIEDNLRLGAVTRKDADLETEIEAIYQQAPILRERRKHPAGTLSGGQQQLLAIGRALMAKPKLLLLDEPSMGLAPLIVEQILGAVVRLKREGMTVMLVEQNAFAALSIADRAYVLETGKVTMAGPGKALLADGRVRQAYLGL
jgi:branched-chain amino acid transport system ATP-binding protein